jgi:hypothetical protein
MPTSRAHAGHAGRTSRRGRWAVLLPLLLWAALPSCTPQGTTPANTDPTVTGIDAAPSTTVIPGATVNLTAHATDADGDSLTYSWSATAGTVAGTTDTATYATPTIEGAYTVTCTVLDGRGGVDTGTLQITVQIGANTDPTVTAINAAPAPTTAPGGTLALTAQATDADGDTLSYAWSTTGGTVAGTTDEATFTAPATEGTYTVTCTVTDGRGGTGTGTLEITVVAAPEPSYVVYMVGGATTDTLYRIEATAGAAPENLSQEMDALAPGADDEFVNISPDAEWLLVQTDRFDADAAGWPGLAVLPADVSAAASVRAPSGLVHSAGACVASGGNLVIYVDGSGARQDLYAISRANTAAAFGEPAKLTAACPYSFMGRPAISEDGTTVLFDAGNDSFPHTAVCEVGTDGSGYREIINVTGGPSGYADANGLISPDYAPSGSIVFEGDWIGEGVWRLAAGATVPTLISVNENNDNSPCVLPDGRIVSLWLDREGNALGVHELKVMDPDGSDRWMLLTGTDVVDAGLGCGG